MFQYHQMLANNSSTSKNRRRPGPATHLRGPTRGAQVLFDSSVLNLILPLVGPDACRSLGSCTCDHQSFSPFTGMVCRSLNIYLRHFQVPKNFHQVQILENSVLKFLSQIASVKESHFGRPTSNIYIFFFAKKLFDFCSGPSSPSTPPPRGATPPALTPNLPTIHQTLSTPQVFFFF